MFASFFVSRLRQGARKVSMISVMPLIVFALGYLVICEAVKFFRNKTTTLPLRSLDTNEEQSVYAALKSICK